MRRSEDGSSGVDRAIAAIGRGEAVIVVDDEDRENEADLVMAAGLATPRQLAFYLRHTSGLICVPMPPEHTDRLELPLMVASNTERQGTAFTVTADYGHGTTTGISVRDRCATIRALSSPRTNAADLRRPGHVLPLRAAPGGVLQRPGHTEAAVDLARLAGLEPVGVICELVDEAKTGMLRGPELQRFASVEGLDVVSIADIARHRRRVERLVRAVGGTAHVMPTEHGEFAATVFESIVDGSHHLAVTMGDVVGRAHVMVRVQTECLPGDVLGSLRCDCGRGLDSAMAAIAAAGRGVVVYLLDQDGRGPTLARRLRGDPHRAADVAVGARELDTAAQIVRELGPASVRLLGASPATHDALVDVGVTVSERRCGQSNQE